MLFFSKGNPEQQFLEALLCTWPVYAVPPFIVLIPTIFLTRKRVVWRLSDALGFILPWLVWVVLFAFGPRDASLASALYESLLLGCGLAMAFIAFAIVGDKRPYFLRALLLLLMFVSAGLTWAFFPFLPE